MASSRPMVPSPLTSPTTSLEPVGPFGVAHVVGHGVLAHAVVVGVPGEPLVGVGMDAVLAQPQFGGVLDGVDALLGRHLRQERLAERGLAASHRGRDHHVGSHVAGNGLHQHLGQLGAAQAQLGERALASEVAAEHQRRRRAHERLGVKAATGRRCGCRGGGRARRNAGSLACVGGRNRHAPIISSSLEKGDDRLCRSPLENSTTIDSPPRIWNSSTPSSPSSSRSRPAAAGGGRLAARGPGRRRPCAAARRPTSPASGPGGAVSAPSAWRAPYGTARTTWAPASSRSSAVSTAWSATMIRAQRHSGRRTGGSDSAGPADRGPEPAVTHTTPAAAAAAVRCTLSLSDGCNATTEAR